MGYNKEYIKVILKMFNIFYKQKGLLHKPESIKESYDNILIMESTESLTNKDIRNLGYSLLEKGGNMHDNWTEVDEDDGDRRMEIKIQNYAKYSTK